jgi:hypothetical protein
LLASRISLLGGGMAGNGPCDDKNEGKDAYHSAKVRIIFVKFGGMGKKM